MENDLLIINQFLSDFPFEVLARSTEDLDNDFRGKLEDLASGKFPDDGSKGRDELAREILSNPDALEYLAELARKRQEGNS